MDHQKQPTEDPRGTSQEASVRNDNFETRGDDGSSVHQPVQRNGVSSDGNRNIRIVPNFGAETDVSSSMRASQPTVEINGGAVTNEAQAALGKKKRKKIVKKYVLQATDTVPVALLD